MAIQANDFQSNSLTGIVTVSGSTITIPLNTNRIYLEGDKTFTVKIRKNSALGEVIDTSPSITLRDYANVTALYANTASVNEGDYVTFKLETERVPNNYGMYYSIEGNTANVDSSDVTPINGSLTIVDNEATVVVRANADASAYYDEGETIQLKLRYGSVSGDVVATSNTVSIIDTSNSALFSSISLTRTTALSSPNMYEGEKLTANVTTTRGEGNNAATFYYTITGNALINGANSGSFIINDNSAEFDIITETTVLPATANAFTIQIRTGGIGGTVQGTSNPVYVQPYTIGVYYPQISRVEAVYPNVVTGYGTDLFTFYIDTASSYTGETLYYSTTGNATTQTGSFNVTSNAATVVLTAENNIIPKTLGLNVYRDSARTKLLGASNSRIYLTPAVPNVTSISSFDESIIEGESFVIPVNTSYGKPGSSSSNLYYTLASNAYIIEGASGTFNPSSNLVLTPLGNIASGHTKYLQFSLRDNSVSGPVVYTSNILYIDDYNGQSPYRPTTTVVTDISANNTGYYYNNGSLLYTIDTVGPASTTLYYTLTGNISAGEVSNESGSISISANTGTLLLIGSGTSSVDKLHKLQVRYGSNTGPILTTDDTDILLSAYTGPIIASGGTIESAGGYTKHIFTSSNTFTITSGSYNPAKANIDYLIVGGGGGGSARGTGGSGGGGGGVQTGTIQLLGGIGSYLANIGAGGSSSSNGTNTDMKALVETFVGIGGGTAGTAGGSGGGGVTTAPGSPGGTGLQPIVGGGGTNYGNNGGASYWAPHSPFDYYSGGGGGGAGGAGTYGGSQPAGGPGGIGIISPLAPDTIGAYDVAQGWNWNPSTNNWNPFSYDTPGGSRYFAGGGGGSTEQQNPGPAPGGKGGGGAGNPSAQYNPPYTSGGARGQPARATSGGGGGGGGHAGGPGGSGGSGVIILRYPSS